MSQGDLVDVLNKVSAQVQTAKVQLVLPKATLDSTAADMGLRLDQTRTAQGALDVGKDDPLPFRPFVWVGSFFHPRKAKLYFAVDSNALASRLTVLEQKVRLPPSEPTVAYQDGELKLVSGKPGKGLDPGAVADELGKVTNVSAGKVTLHVDMIDISPTYKDSEAQKVVDDVMANTKSPPVATVAGESPRPFDGDRLRRLATAVPGRRPDGKGLVLMPALDPAGTATLLREMFPDVGTKPANASVRVVSDQVVVDPGVPGTACCDPASVNGIATALLSGQRTIDLQLESVAPTKDTDYFAKLGISEKVAEFTTNHPSGAPRVTNIHRIADLVQGAVVEPGQTFSVNDYVGPRTRAKGFVAAPVIGENGYFSDDVGGGVSQFATTMFNAAFFAGLEIPEYQAHGIYISRYPYGREATLDYGNIDLKVRNNTPFGILLWPTYTDSSITVSIYSTRYIEAGQDSQTTEQYGAVCTRVSTVRKRTWVTTGEAQLDKFYALYTPSEGLQCDGSTLPNPAAPPPPPTTTTAPGSPPAPSASVPATSAPAAPPTSAAAAGAAPPSSPGTTG
ncbi:MAG: hypothetical protein QOJ19_4033 [Acidimicrobiia bacterium]|nr:hypothetical protein [Acidimicrobiia bacterium]